MLRAFAVVPFAACLLAQEAPDPLRYVPPNAALVLRAKGPAAWRAEFGGTGLGRALGNPAIATAAKGIRDYVARDLDLGTELTKRLDGLWTAVASYDGVMVVGASVELPIAARHQAPHFSVSLAAFGDGHTDLSVVAATLRELLPPDGARELSIGGIDLRVHRFDGASVTEPVVHDGAVLMFCSDDLEVAVQACLANRAKPFPATAELLRGVVGLQCEFQPFLPGLFESIAIEEGPQTPFLAMLPQLVEELGGRSLVRGAYTVFADGKQIAQEGMLEFGAGPRGFFDVVLPVRRSAPVLTRYLPPGTMSFSLTSFDLDALHRLYVQMFTAHADQLPMKREQFEREFTELTKLRLHEDLLALIGEEMLSIEDLAVIADTDEEEDEDQAAGIQKLMERYGDTSYVLRLRDGKTFAANLEKMVRARGLHAGRKSEEYGGVRVYGLKLLGAVPIEYACAGDVMVLAVGGEGSQKNLRSVLDAVAAEARGEAPAGLPAALQARLAALPPDYTHLSGGALGEAIGYMLLALEGMTTALAAEDLTLEDIDGVWHLMPAALKALKDDLKRFDADVSVTAGYSAKDRAWFRSRW